MTMISDKIEAIKAAVDEQIAKSEALQDVQNIRVKYLGKKGELTSIMKDLKICPRKNGLRSASLLIRPGASSKTI